MLRQGKTSLHDHSTSASLLTLDDYIKKGLIEIKGNGGSTKKYMTIYENIPTKVEKLNLSLPDRKQLVQQQSPLLEYRPLTKEVVEAYRSSSIQRHHQSKSTLIERQSDIHVSSLPIVLKHSPSKLQEHQGQLR